MKSRTTSAVLTVLLGPLGLFYTTVWGALALTVLAFVSAPTIIGPLFAWVVSIFWGDSLVKKHNSTLNLQPAPPAPVPRLPRNRLLPRNPHRERPAFRLSQAPEK